MLQSIGTVTAGLGRSRDPVLVLGVVISLALAVIVLAGVLTVLGALAKVTDDLTTLAVLGIAERHARRQDPED